MNSTQSEEGEALYEFHAPNIGHDGQYLSSKVEWPNKEEQAMPIRHGVRREGTRRLCHPYAGVLFAICCHPAMALMGIHVAPEKDNTLELEIFDVSDLAKDGFKIAALLRRRVEPASWGEDWPASLDCQDGKLVVMHYSSVQERIREWLRQLRELSSRHRETLSKVRQNELIATADPAPPRALGLPEVEELIQLLDNDDYDKRELAERTIANHGFSKRALFKKLYRRTVSLEVQIRLARILFEFELLELLNPELAEWLDAQDSPSATAPHPSSLKP